MSTADIQLTKYHLEDYNETHTHPNTQRTAMFIKFTKSPLDAKQSITDPTLILCWTDNHTPAYRIFGLLIVSYISTVIGKEICLVPFIHSEFIKNVVFFNFSSKKKKALSVAV